MRVACILTVNERLLSAISGHSPRSRYVHSERLLSGKRPFALARNSNTRMSAFFSQADVKEHRFRLKLMGVQLKALQRKSDRKSYPLGFSSYAYNEEFR